MLRIPHKYARRLALRGAMFWGLVHVALAMRGGGAIPTLPGAILLGAVCATLSYTEIVFRRESIFMQNLGVPTLHLLIIPAAVSVLLDAVLIVGARVA